MENGLALHRAAPPNTARPINLSPKTKGVFPFTPDPCSPPPCPRRFRKGTFLTPHSLSLSHTPSLPTSRPLAVISDALEFSSALRLSRSAHRDSAAASAAVAEARSDEALWATDSADLKEA